MKRGKTIRMAAHRTSARRVDFIENIHDFESIVLGSLGFSYSFISAKTGLTKCQIGYRLQKADERVMDYRNGTSQVAKEVRKNAWEIASKVAKNRIRKASLTAHRQLALTA